MKSLPTHCCRVLSPASLTELDKKAWSALAARQLHAGGAFLTWQYAVAVGSVNHRARVAILEKGDGPEAFLAFQPKLGNLGMLGVHERIGGQLSDYFGIVAAPEFRICPEVLTRLCGIAALEFSHLDESQLMFGLTGDMPRVGLRIDLPNGGNAYLDELRQRKKGVVRETDRRLRRLNEQVGPVRLEMDLRSRPDVLDTLIAAKMAQYSRTGKEAGAALAEPWAQSLLRTLFHMSDPECRGQLTALYAGDTWVALHFGLRAGNTLHYWFPVYNHELASYGPGRLLLQMTISAAAQNGISLIDRGEGDTPSKREYATSEHAYFRGLWISRGVRGVIGSAAQRLYWKLDARRVATVSNVSDHASGIRQDKQVRHRGRRI